MGTIQFGGLSSGLDTASIISALMETQKKPLTRVTSDITAANTRYAAYTTLNGLAGDLLAKAQSFTLFSAGSARAATSADPTKFTATAGYAASPGVFKISVDRLASSTKATSTAAIGTAVTDATAGTAMSSLPLPGTVKAGTLGLVVDGKIVKVTVGDPATASLQSVLDDIASAVQGSINAGSGTTAADLGATVTASIVANHLSLSVSGAAAGHDLRFGVAGDTSNFLALTGLSSQHVTGFGTTTSAVTGSAALGVIRSTGALDAAGLTGLAGTSAGTLSINGATISYDTATDSLGTILSRINASSAGVIASLDRTNDRVSLTRKTPGAQAIDITDTGALATALRLAPGTTDAQVIGQTSQITVDGRTITSETNTVTGAVDGVTLNLVDVSTAASSLTVGTDTTSIQASLQSFVDSFNTFVDQMTTLTTHAKGASVSALEEDSGMRSLALEVRGIITAPSSSMTGSIRSLADIGITTGSIGSAVGTTSHLKLDATKLAAALASDPTQVAQLLNSATSGVMQPVIAKLKTITGAKGLVITRQASITSQLSYLSNRAVDLQDRIDRKQVALEAQFAKLESTLSTLQQTQSQLTAQSNANSSSGN